jgi:hypothetical protein
MNLLSIEAGKTLQYNNTQWTLKKIIEYQWGELLFSYDYLIDNGTEIQYLGIEKNIDNLILSMKKDIPIDSIDLKLKEYILKNEVPPRTLNMNDIIYYFDRESVGKCKLENTTDWTKLTVWEYIDKTNKNVLTIEQYGDNDFFSSVGTIIQMKEILYV